MKTATLAVSCLLVLSPLGIAIAQETAAPARPAERPLIGGHGNAVEAFIAQHDDNADGKVSWAEFEAFRKQRFDATDENGDGALDVEEYVQEFKDRSRQAMENARGGHIEQTHTRFKSMDTDGDGALTRAEFDASGERAFSFYEKQKAEKATAKAKDGDKKEREPRRRNPLSMPTSHSLEGMLELYDANGDGNVERAEFDAAREALFKRIDADGNGKLGREEYLAEFEDRLDRRIATLGEGSDRQTRVRFESMDADKDGRMTWEEYQVSGKRLFDRADRNSDGVVDAADAALPPPPMPERDAAARPGAGKSDAAQAADKAKAAAKPAATKPAY